MTLVGDSTSHGGSTRGGVIGRDGLVWTVLCVALYDRSKGVSGETSLDSIVVLMNRRNQPEQRPGGLFNMTRQRYFSFLFFFSSIAPNRSLLEIHRN